MLGRARLNSISSVSVLATLLPTAFFAALDRGANSPASGAADVSTALVNDNIRDEILRISRGIAVALLIV